MPLETHITKLLNEIHNTDYSSYQYFAKGDISGIQDFIFDVQSKGASKTLKSRSFFIEVIAEICENAIREKLGGQVAFLYNGGGNFYFFIKDQESIAILEQLIDKFVSTLYKEKIFVSITSVPFQANDLEQFGEVWKNLNQKANVQKLQKFKTHIGAFDPFPSPREEDTNKERENWRSFSKVLTKKNHFDIEKGKQLYKQIGATYFELFGRRLKLSDNGEKLATKVVNKLPTWNPTLWELKKAYIEEHDKNVSDPSDKIEPGNIVEFNQLADFAKERTGTAKMAVLKMDIDNLGSLFAGIDSIHETRKLSKTLAWFFEEHMYNLLQTNFTFKQKGANGNMQEKTDLFLHNIYVVFAGGDDCFMIGAWDAIFQFAQVLNNAFAAFAQVVKTKLPSLAAKTMTLSASLLILDPHFPVVRLADMAEDEIKEAKSYTDKNRVSVMGNVLTWEEFEQANRTAHKLQYLIQEKDESRVILNRIKQSAKGYEKLQNEAVIGNVTAPKVWRLHYFIRHSKNPDAIQDIIDEYSVALMDVFAKKQKKNPMLFPIAARWAEFLTRKA